MILQGILIGIAVVMVGIMSRTLTTLIHELGHAIPALLFTKEKVEILVGSSGNIDNCIRINTGRLTSYISLNLFSLKGGLCAHERLKHVWQELLVVLGGPSFSVVLSLLLLAIGLNYELPGWSKILMGLFVVSAVLDFFTNIIPMKNPMRLYDGRVVYNDGARLVQLHQSFKNPEGYKQAKNFYQKGKLQESIEALKLLIGKGESDRNIYRFLLEILLEKNQYTEAESYSKSYLEKLEPEASDYALFGKIKLGQNQLQEAISYFDQALYFSYQDVELLNLRGTAQLQAGNFRIGKADFEAALHYQANYLDALINLGLAKIKLGELGGAFQDLEKARSIDQKNPKTYLNLAYYYTEKGAYTKAIEYLEQAKLLGSDHHGIDFQLAELKRKINH